jgi:hypothetical protein
MSPKAIAACQPDFPVPPGSAKSPQNMASALWNAMAAPFTPVAVRAALWYQGEANADQGLHFKGGSNYSTAYYACMIQAMAADWRERKGMGDFAFMAVQLPPSIPPADKDAKSTGRQEVRAATALLASHPGGLTDISGIAVTMDLGGKSAWGYDHPPNKNEMARRLGLATLHAAYALQSGNDKFGIQFTGPVLESIASSSSSVTLTFNATSGTGLKLGAVKDCTTCCGTKNGNGFEVSTNGGMNWTAVPLASVQAGIKGSTISFSTSAIADAAVTNVRYAWTDFVNCVLYNDARLPLGPFSRAVNQQNGVKQVQQVQQPVPVRDDPITEPPMGFNSWNYYHCNIDENTIKALADVMETNGMKDAGYEYM